jgi:hypothetical protein
MKEFIERSRDLLTSPVGYPMLLEEDLEEARAKHVLTNYADAMLNAAVRCLLVGLDAPGEQLLVKAASWLQLAIESSEKQYDHNPDRNEANRFGDLALCNWLLHNKHDRDNLHQAVVHLERYLAGVPEEHLVAALSKAFLIYLDAGEHSRIITWCEGHGLFPLSDAMEDVELDAMEAGGMMARVLALRRLGSGPPQAVVDAMLRTFLPLRLEAKFDLLQFDSVARWMKIIHWREEGALSSRAALLKCYQDME